MNAPPPGSDSVILRSSRKRAIICLALLLFIFGLMALFTHLDRQNFSAFHFCVLAAAGLPALFFASQLLPGANFLQLHPDALIICRVWRKSRYPWRDISEFGTLFITENKVYQKRVAFNFRPGVKKPSFQRLRRWLRNRKKASAPFDVHLPDLYLMKAEALASLLEEWRARRSYGS